MRASERDSATGKKEDAVRRREGGAAANCKNCRQRWKRVIEMLDLEQLSLNTYLEVGRIGR